MTAPVTVTPLLPCPFCGCEAHPVWHTLENTWGAHCSECTAKLYYVGLSAAEAAAAWNTRTQSAAASDAQIAELREALDSIDVWLSDTLSGRVQPDPATYKQWLIDAIVEARGRARKALARAKSSSDGEG